MDVGHSFKNLIRFLWSHGVELTNKEPAIVHLGRSQHRIKAVNNAVYPFIHQTCGNLIGGVHAERERSAFRAIELS